MCVRVTGLANPAQWLGVKGEAHVVVKVGLDIFSHFGHRRRFRLHRHIGRERRYSQDSVLYLRGDFPGVACFWLDGRPKRLRLTPAPLPWALRKGHAYSRQL